MGDKESIHVPVWNEFNPEVFDAWKNGNTGYPFVDANMRELNATGFMR